MLPAGSVVTVVKVNLRVPVVVAKPGTWSPAEPKTAAPTADTAPVAVAEVSVALDDTESTGKPKLFPVLTVYDPEAPFPSDQEPIAKVSVVTPAGTKVVPVVQIMVAGVAAVGGHALGAAATAFAKLQATVPVDIWGTGLSAPAAVLK